MPSPGHGLPLSIIIAPIVDYSYLSPTGRDLPLVIQKPLSFPPLQSPETNEAFPCTV